jgi:hypothetical protein
MSSTTDHKNHEIHPATLREQIKIPRLPADTNKLSILPPIEMRKLEIINGKLVFENKEALEDVLKNGFFLLKIPSYLSLDGCDRFVSNFYKEKNGSIDDEYKGYKNVHIDADYQGYFDRTNDQWENFYIEASNWKNILPYDVQKAGLTMVELGINIIKSILNEIGIPEPEWGKITGGLTANNGHKMLAFNHFRPEKDMRGSKLHRDSGWVTVLRSTAPGLVALIGESLYAINPVPGYFIINFGSTFEVLTKDYITPVRANIHGVIKTLKQNSEDLDRKSYVIFLDSDLSGFVYRYSNNRAVAVQSMRDFAIQEVSRTYDDNAYL